MDNEPIHLKPAKQLSPLRNSTRAGTIDELVSQQLEHFAIDPNGAYGNAMSNLARNLYGASLAVDDLWRITIDTLAHLDRSDRIAYFNAKRFACFQLAKILDNLQNPMRATYQFLASAWETQSLKGPYPIFDNVAAIFSATPVITRTATYLYACIEWVEDAFKGRELMHDIYSRPQSDFDQPRQPYRRSGGRPLGAGTTWPGTSIPAWPQWMPRWRTLSATRTSCFPAAMSMAAPINCCMIGTANAATWMSRSNGSTDLPRLISMPH